MAKDFDKINLLEFQQPINCCNVTAVAYAFAALGYPIAVDDIFYATKLPIASVLDDGMSLQETSDVATKYVQAQNLPLDVKSFHMDPGRMSFEEFAKMLKVASDDEQDIHIFNFNVSIAHDIPSLRGGHFSLLADYNPKTSELTIADTNPRKYGRYWSCKAKDMYDACCDVDTGVGRARGFISIEKKARPEGKNN